MPRAHPELTAALVQLIGKLERQLPEESPQVKMYLAGGMAMHFHCGSRYTLDVDATFSHRLLVNFNELRVTYQRDDGRPADLYLDANYNDTFALMHPDYRDDAIRWSEVSTQSGRVSLFVLTPLDLAISKVARFSQVDREDISTLCASGLLDSAALERRALEALDYYVGDTRWIKQSLQMVRDHLDSGAPL